MTNDRTKKIIKIGSVEKVVYGSIGVSFNTSDNEIFFVTAKDGRFLERLQKDDTSILLDYLEDSRKISIKTPVKWSCSYVNPKTSNSEQPGLILRYRDSRAKDKTHLIILTEKGDLKEVFKEFNSTDIEFLGTRSIVNNENPEPEFSYKLVVYNKKIGDYEIILAFIDSNGNITKTLRNEDGHIYYLENSNRYQYTNNHDELSGDYYDSFGKLQLKGIKTEILVTEIILKDMFVSGKYHIYRAIAQDGSDITYMINAETGELVAHLNSEVDCAKIFNEILYKFGVGTETMPYIREQKR